MNTTGESKFKISVGDDPDHEDLAAEIYYDGVYVATISQERGIESAEVEFEAKKNSGEPILIKIPLSDFIKSMESAKSRLWDLRRM